MGRPGPYRSRANGGSGLLNFLKVRSALSPCCPLSKHPESESPLEGPVPQFSYL
jgi:hypothetical protein